MKKINKILAPIITCSALATIVPLVATSCTPKEDTYPVDYTVIGNCVYGVNKEGAVFELSESQFDDIAGDFFAVRADGTLTHFSHKDKSAPKTIGEFLKRADEQQIWGYELYLVSGVYEFGPTEEATKATMNTFYIKGLSDYEGNKMATIKGYQNDDGEDIAPVILNDKLNLLQFINLNILGSKYQTTGWNNMGIIGASKKEINTMYFMNCDFIGKEVFDAKTLFFTNCTFDSTVVEVDPEVQKTDYCVWLKNAEDAYFYWCRFDTRGKAIKVFHPEQWPSDNYASQYVLNQCAFNISDVPPAGTDNDQNKCCLEIENDYSKEHPLFVYWKNVNGYVGDKNYQGVTDYYKQEIYTPQTPTTDRTTEKFWSIVGKRGQPDITPITPEEYPLHKDDAYFIFPGCLPSW